MSREMLSTLWTKVTEAGAGVLALLLLAFISLAPYLVARGFPEQASRYTFLLAVTGVFVSMAAALLALMQPARRVASITIFICAGAVWLYTWVWSVLIVDGTFGLATLYIANLFLGVGAIVVAFLGLLFGAHWLDLGLLIFCIFVALVMQFGATAIYASTDATPSFSSYGDRE